MFVFKTNFKLLVSVALALALSSQINCTAQGMLRERLQHRLSASKQTEIGQTADHAYKELQLAGLSVAVWEPKNYKKAAPLVIFSHGFTGKNTQSAFIMEALANKGYLVIAPNHKDAIVNGPHTGKKPTIAFKDAAHWNDSTYRDRHDDIVRLLKVLHKDEDWKNRINWSQLALCGHSLGGYTVLGLGGAWPSWKATGIKAILALSPYCAPYLLKGDLANLDIPVMYQGGTRDFGITPSVKKANGAFSQTSKPAFFVEFAQLGHLGWTNYNKNQAQKDLINYYCLAFLDKYVRGHSAAKPEIKLAAVVDLRAK